MASELMITELLLTD